MKKRPTWATVVGVLGIIFSSFGILGAGQTMLMPKMLQFQKQMFSTMTTQMESDSAKNQTSPDAAEVRIQTKVMFENMQKMWNLPEWYNTWSVITGLLQLLICGFYLFVCIGLLQIKPASIKMFYCAAGAIIAHGVLNGIVGVMASSFMVMITMLGSAFGMVIHIVLLIVVATANKDAFLPITSQS